MALPSLTNEAATGQDDITFVDVLVLGLSVLDLVCGPLDGRLLLALLVNADLATFTMNLIPTCSHNNTIHQTHTHIYIICIYIYTYV